MCETVYVTLTSSTNHKNTNRETLKIHAQTFYSQSPDFSGSELFGHSSVFRWFLENEYQLFTVTLISASERQHHSGSTGPHGVTAQSSGVRWCVLLCVSKVPPSGTSALEKASFLSALQSYTVASTLWWMFCFVFVFCFQKVSMCFCGWAPWLTRCYLYSVNDTTDTKHQSHRHHREHWGHFLRIVWESGSFY